MSFLMIMTTAEKTIILKIGTKGEIFPPKEVREKLGLLQNQPIIMTVHGDQLIIRKLHSIESILEQPAKVTISSHAWKQFRRELGEDLEK
jgi:AbrB family looped-hinge helix DNA binding protein